VVGNKPGQVRIHFG